MSRAKTTQKELVQSKSSMRIIGLTGGIASGKSTATNFLREKNQIVICADEISHRLTAKDQIGWQKIRKSFGAAYFLPTGELDRNKLALAVFGKPALRRRLEAILHPLVRGEILKEIGRQQKQRRLRIIFIDVPLLFESGFDRLCDEVICVYANQKTRIQRMKTFRKMSVTEAKARIQAQMPLLQKVQRADVVWKNSTDRQALFTQIRRYLGKWK